MARKLKIGIGALGGLGMVLYCAVLWQPERQVRLHQRHLLQALEERNWKQLNEKIGAGYVDRWNHNKESLISQSREVLGQFLVLGVEAQASTVEMENAAGVVSERIIIKGSGSPVAQLVMERVNGLHAPFTFRWEHRSWKPWDWQLMSIDQPELVITEL